MLSETHKLIAHAVYKVLQSELKVDLDYKSFRYGSIAPDIFPTMMFLPHSLDSSIGMINENIKKLSSIELPANKKEMRVFSFKLGVIIHFISDYFCKAHNERRYDNLVLHLIYENRLKRFFEKRIKSIPPFGKTICRTDTKSSLADYVREMHKEYNGIKKSMTNDLKYSLSMSASVALEVVACIMAKDEAARLRKIA